MNISNCQNCGQAAISRDSNGPICPDCIEEGYSEHEDTSSGDLIPRDEITPQMAAEVLLGAPDTVSDIAIVMMRGVRHGKRSHYQALKAALTAIKESKDE